MWRYKVKVKNKELNGWDFLYYVSRNPSFNIHALIKQNNGSDDNNFILHEDGSLSWWFGSMYYSYNNLLDLLEHVQNIHIEKI